MTTEEKHLNPTADASEIDPQLDVDIDFNKCFCLVKFNYTAFIHAIWVEFSTVESLGKTRL